MRDICIGLWWHNTVVSNIMKVADRLYRTGEEIRDELKKGMDEAKEDYRGQWKG